MAYGAWQATIVSEINALPVPGASIHVTLSDGGGSATLYQDRDGGSTLSNPFDANDSGFARFYCEPGRYNITASSDDEESEWVDVIITEEVGSGGAPETIDMTISLSNFVTDATGSYRVNGDYIEFEVWVRGGGTSIIYGNVTTLPIPKSTYPVNPFFTSGNQEKPALFIINKTTGQAEYQASDSGAGTSYGNVWVFFNGRYRVNAEE